MSKASLQWLAIGLHPLHSAAAALRLHQGPKKEIHEGHTGEKSYPRRGWRRLERGLPRIAKRRKNFHEKEKRYPRRATKNGEGPLRGWRRLERDPPRVGKGRKDFQEKAKRFPRRATKNGKGPLRGWRRLERDPPRVATGRKDFQEKAKRFPRRAAKGLEKTRKGAVRGHEERHSGGKDLDLPGSAGVPPASGPRRRFRPRLRAREQTGNILYTINRKQGSVVSLLNDPPGRSGTRLTRISHRVAGYRLGKCFF